MNRMPYQPGRDDLDEPDDTSTNVGDPALGKTRLLARQCRTCIFRPGNAMHLRQGRLRELVAHALARESFIVCHATLPGMYPDTQPAVCRGFVDRYSTQALQVISRLWGFAEVDPPGESEPHPTLET